MPDTIEKDLQRETNRLEKAEITQVSPEVITSIENVIKELGKEKIRIKQLIDDHIDQHPNLKQDRTLLESIPGVGALSSRNR